jgi:molybdate/tungstate transport system substrate-binding protein
MLKALLPLTLLASPLLADPAPRPAKLIIYHAGSVSEAFRAAEALFTQRTGIVVKDVAGGSVALARQVTSGQAPCDLYAGADFEVIDQMLIPDGFASYSIRFASGAMVLAYSTSSKQAATIAAPGKPFNPPGSVPEAAKDWYLQLCQPGVKIAGSHPFLDPGAYRADLIFQLAQDFYHVPTLYGDLLAHYTIGNAPGGLGTAFDYQFTYEHGALAKAKADPGGTFRYVRLPDEINLGAPERNAQYAKRSITIPGLQGPSSPATATLPASRVEWGIALLNKAPNPGNAVAFLELLCGKDGAEILKKTGPTPICPPQVSKGNFAHLPASLKALVQPGK